MTKAKAKAKPKGTQTKEKESKASGEDEKPPKRTNATAFANTKPSGSDLKRRPSTQSTPGNQKSLKNYFGGGDKGKK